MGFIRRLVAASLLLFYAHSTCLAESQIKADPRLDQKVTYDGGYKRLHDVADDLSKLTGVKIRSGKTKDDWRVRDVPVIVFVKDMPLGKVLQALSDATHTQLFRKDASDAPPSYSIYRGPAAEKEATAPLDAKIQANIALTDWAWDALTAFGDVSEGQMPAALPKAGPYEFGVDPKQPRSVGKALKALGPDARAKVFAGEQVSVKASSNPQIRSAIKDVFPSICAANVSDAGNGFAFYGKAAMPTDSEIDRSVFIIRLSQKTGSASVHITGVPVVNEEGRRSYDSWSADPVKLATPLTFVRDLRLPARPDVDPNAKPKERYPGETIVIEKDNIDDLPALKKRVEIKLPEGKKHPSREGVLRAFHESSGLNIICEDFASHRYGFYGWGGTNFGAEPTWASVIKAVNVPAQRPGPWFLNEKEGLLLGWTGAWRERHSWLVPESVIAPIVKKAKGEGAELDDLIPVVWLETRQRLEWVSGCEELITVDTPSDPDARCFWKLYDSLDPRDKLLARSEEGLKLGKLGPAWLKDFISSEMAIDSQGIVHLSAPEDNPQRMARLKVLADADSLSRLTLRITIKPLEIWSVVTIDDEGYPQHFMVDSPKPGYEKHSYTLEVTGDEGLEFHLTSNWRDVAFPLYSPERDAYLRGKAGVNAKKE